MNLFHPVNPILWTFPAIMLASVVIGWAAEVAALHISAGLALAILAFLQTLPEFGVEAFISWSGNKSLMLANLTGSLRLFIGFGWPMVFFIHAFSLRFGRAKRWPLEIRMPRSFATEATFLWAPLLYFSFITFRQSMYVVDGIVLSFMYLVYLFLLNNQRIVLKDTHEEELPEEAHDLDGVPLAVSRLKTVNQLICFNLMFLIGGAILYLAVHPFVEGLKGAALALGMSEFVFIQWVAPFASEMPEKITAFGWAAKAKKVPLAIFNMVSSSVNQWTLLAGMVPIIYYLSPHRDGDLIFDTFQKTELCLTLAQSALGALFLSDLRFKLFEACGLFVLWLVQFLLPHFREEVLIVYVLWAMVYVLNLILRRHMPEAWKEFYHLLRRISRKKRFKTI